MGLYARVDDLAGGLSHSQKQWLEIGMLLVQDAELLLDEPVAGLTGADLDVMDRDSRRMRGERPFVFTNLKAGDGLPEIVRFIEEAGGLDAASA